MDDGKDLVDQLRKALEEFGQASTGGGWFGLRLTPSLILFALVAAFNLGGWVILVQQRPSEDRVRQIVVDMEGTPGELGTARERIVNELIRRADDNDRSAVSQRLEKMTDRIYALERSCVPLTSK